MLTRRLLFPAVLCLWVVLLLGLSRVEKAGPDQSRPRSARSEVEHQRLIEFLDQIVLQQHYYRSLHGQYTRLLNRLSLLPSEEIIREYEISVTRADQDGLEVVASSERINGREERVSIDQDYRLHANFPIPPPRPEWLKLQAARVIRQAYYGGLTEAPAETGVFKGYFRYEARQRKPKLVLMAVGVKMPVEGHKVTLEDANALVALEEAPDAGQVESSFGTSWSEILFAQKIHWGEKGRYGKTIDELRPYLSQSVMALIEDPKQLSELERAITASQNVLAAGAAGAAYSDRKIASDSLLIEPVSEELEIEKIASE